ncbi:hypothetical protein FOT57_11995 [Serratia ureilytica]|uniref:hypothetical protein n=1 Tax=Serratia ureilytica TaxID=300181 RepID=UPI0011C84EDD|nr:hypothetical protein [Serratia ureilytica]TXE56508.1 hypothetical protein FOT57_11995 [Serratia ureilytica]
MRNSDLMSSFTFFVINVGRQLFICVHVFSLVNVMNINVLSAPLDRGRQTYRSEIVQAVQGMIPLAVVRPAPLFCFLHSDRTIGSTGGDA